VDGLRCQPLARESLFLCGRDADGSVAAQLHTPPFVAAPRPEIDFAQAARLPLLLQTRFGSIRRHLDDVAHELAIALNVEFEQDSALAIRSLCIGGFGFTITPASTLGDYPAAGDGWIAARVVRPELQRSYFVATAADRPIEPATRVVLDAVFEQSRRLVRQKRWDAQLLAPTA